jgi:hypothetical protein
MIVNNPRERENGEVKGERKRREGDSLNLFLNGEKGFVIVTTRSTSKQRNQASEAISRNSKMPDAKAHEFWSISSASQ